MKTLDELADSYVRTDKKKHGYMPFYDMLFAPIRLSVKKVLEIGINKGDSLRLWRDFFPSAIVYGWDCSAECCFQEPRIISRIVNHDNKPQVLAELEAIGKAIDVIIDDGSHWQESQQRLLAWCLPYVAAGGLYVTEDLHASTVPGMFGLKNDKSNSTYCMFTGLQLNGAVESACLTDEEKAYIQRVAGRLVLSSSLARVENPFKTSIVSALFKK